MNFNSSAKKKIALCIPNLAWQDADKSVVWHITPYNLCLLASMIRDFCDVKIVDANFYNYSHEEFQAQLTEYQPDVVGITVMMDQFAKSGHLASSLAREALPDCVITMGGVYTTINHDQAVQDPNIDYVFRGEGEYTTKEFLRYLWFGEEFPQKGLVWDNNSRQAPYHDGNITTQERADLIADLDSIPFPAYDLIDYPKYTYNAPRTAVGGPIELPCARLITSRGCPQNCCFCQVKIISGRKFRPRSPENIVEEMLWYKNTYGVKSLILDDDNIVTNKARAVKLFKMMAEQVKLPWTAGAMAVFMLDEELIDLMAESGCKFLGFAIESGSRRILDEIIKKPVKFDHAIKMASYAQSKGIFISSNFIIGFPTETWEEIRETCSFAEELNADYIRIFTAIPLRHTRLWGMCEELSYFKEGFKQSEISWNEGQISSPHFSAKELTLLRAFEWDRINFKTPEKCKKIADIMGITIEELNQIRKETRELALSRI